MMSRSSSSKQMAPGLGNGQSAAGPERAHKGRAGRVGNDVPQASGAVMAGGDQDQCRGAMSNDGSAACGKNTL